MQIAAIATRPELAVARDSARFRDHNGACVSAEFELRVTSSDDDEVDSPP